MIKAGDFVVPMETPNTGLGIVDGVSGEHVLVRDPKTHNSRMTYLDRVFPINYAIRRPSNPFEWLVDTIEFWYYRLTGKY